ncbi:MAG: DNA repair protein RecN [Lentisphaeria bacterium]|nr:DNA repair protein RecN [Lentisphaeria bacterium]
MLSYLKINDYALIESAEVEFNGGFTAVTGESGAGKSIMMSAVELLCGGKGGKEAIRTGCSKCTVSGIFTIPPELREPMRELLLAKGVELEEEFTTLTLRRVISHTYSRAFIEDVPVTNTFLAEAGSLLIDRHSANEHLSLTLPARQLELLDIYANLQPMRRECAAICAQINELQEEEKEFAAALPDAASADRLQLMAEEIDAVSPLPGEDEELAARQKRGANARTIIESAGTLVDMLTENENSVADQLGSVYHILADLERIDPTLTGELTATCAELQNNIAGFSAAIAQISDKVELDPEALAAIEERLSAIFTLKRRYGPTLEQLLAAREDAGRKLAAFHAGNERTKEFARRRKELENALLCAAKKLSHARREHAEEFLGKVTAKLASIGFANALLKASFTPTPPGPSGMDKLELLFCPNRGEELRPLRKIASSGELSRLMLALKTVLADADATPTVIFDEIDMNIGGETANFVGDELKLLGSRRQILCISHLPQVAARADEHFMVKKYT